MAAALAALNGEASGVPKSRDGLVEAIRALRLVRRSAVKARTQASNQLRDLILTAPEQVRASSCAGLPRGGRWTWRPGSACGTSPAPPHASGRRWLQWPAAPGARRRDRPARCRARGTRHARSPGKVPGQAGCGHPGRRHAAGHRRRQPRPAPHRGQPRRTVRRRPVDASSGKQIRHRLNRGGDRQANSALWTIILTRLAHDPRTQAYLARRTAEGLTTPEIIRCLKRYIAREIYKALYRPKTAAPIQRTSQTRSFGSDLDVGASAVSCALDPAIAATFGDECGPAGSVIAARRRWPPHAGAAG